MSSQFLEGEKGGGGWMDGLMDGWMDILLLDGHNQLSLFTKRLYLVLYLVL
jgi:hypothetical protein